MHTEIILTKNIQGLGAEGDKVSVAPGYARNYLLPRGLARLATEASVRHIDALKKKRTERETAEKGGAEELAARIATLTCAITVKTGQQDKMFGSVTAGDIHDYLVKEGIQADRKQVALEKPIHQVGEHHVTINLLHGVTAQLKVVITAAAPAPAAATADRRAGRRPERAERPERRTAEKKTESRPTAKSAHKEK